MALTTDALDVLGSACVSCVLHGHHTAVLPRMCPRYGLLYGSTMGPPYSSRLPMGWQPPWLASLSSKVAFHTLRSSRSFQTVSIYQTTSLSGALSLSLSRARSLSLTHPRNLEMGRPPLGAPLGRPELGPSAVL
jgi:hypothetical protein